MCVCILLCVCCVHTYIYIHAHIYIHVFMCVKSYQSCLTLRPHGPQLARILCPWDSPGKNTGVGCHVLLQGIFPTQGWNPRLLHLLHWQVGSLPLLASGKSSYSNSGLFNWVYFYLFTTLNTLWQGIWRLHFTRGIHLTLRNSLHLQNIP